MSDTDPAPGTDPQCDLVSELRRSGIPAVTERERAAAAVVAEFGADPFAMARAILRMRSVMKEAASMVRSGDQGYPARILEEAAAG